MVDYTMLRRIYPNKRIFENNTDDLGEEAMNKTEPPDDDFLAMLPPYIFGFDIDSKAWSKCRTAIHDPLPKLSFATQWLTGSQGLSELIARRLLPGTRTPSIG